MARSEVLKQYRDLAKNLKSFTQGQARLVQDEQDGDSLERIRIDISPNSGPYRGGRFKFELELGELYPEQVPRIRCLNSVYHPNIEVLDRFSDGEVCVNLLDELWSHQLTLEDYVQGLLFSYTIPTWKTRSTPRSTGRRERGNFSATSAGRCAESVSTGSGTITCSLRTMFRNTKTSGRGWMDSRLTMMTRKTMKKRIARGANRTTRNYRYTWWTSTGRSIIVYVDAFGYVRCSSYDP